MLSDTERALGLAFGACSRASDPVPNRVTYVIDAEGRVERAIETRDPASQALELSQAL